MNADPGPDGRRLDPAADWGARLREVFDQIGDSEWDRLGADARGRAALEVHRRFLTRHLPEGARVLEVGAGPGRFTIELARMGCEVVVGDISPVQLAANAARVQAAGLEGRVRNRVELDVRDLSGLPDEAFDAVVAYGGPLSYAFELAEAGLAHMLRAVRPGGVVVAGVMDLPGTFRFFLPGVATYVAGGHLETLARIVATGDNRHEPRHHPCRLFRWSEIQAIAGRLPCRVAGASASNFLSCGDQEELAEIERDPAVWQRFLDWEVELCAEPGALDGGTHLLFALERT